MIGKVKIGDVLSQGWELYKVNFGLLFGGTIVAIFVGGAVCGILTGPMMIGLFQLIEALSKKAEKPTLGLVFGGFDKFGAAFVAWLVVAIVTFALSTVAGMVPLIGILLSIFVSMVGGAANLTAILFVSRRGMQGMEAVKDVLRGTFNGTYMNYLLACVVLALVGSAGVILCGIGVFFTLPIYYAATYFAYRVAFESAEETVPAAEPVSPAEPAA